MITHPSLAVFDDLPLPERLFVRARLMTAPLEELTTRIKGERILDVGCGHGLLCSLMALTGQESSHAAQLVQSSVMEWDTVFPPLKNGLPSGKNHNLT